MKNCSLLIFNQCVFKSVCRSLEWRPEAGFLRPEAGRPPKFIFPELASNFGQLSKPGTVLESACHEGSKTAPESSI